MPSDVGSEVLNIIKRSPQAARNPMGYMRTVMGDYALRQLNRSIAGCNACKFPCKSKTLCHGKSSAPLMVLMDYPAEIQTKNGKATDFFAGIEDIKKYFNNIFTHFGVDMNEIFFMNTLSGCPVDMIDKADGKQEAVYRPPKSAEIENCSSFVHYAIDVVHPQMIILMGNVALNVFHKAAITKFRGSWIYPYCIPAMATYNPIELKNLKGQIDVEQYNNNFKDYVGDIANAIKAFRRMHPDSRLFLSKGE